MKFKSIDVFSDEQKKAALSVFDKEQNKYICETAGYIPLEVKLRQFEQNGLIAQFQVSDFDSNDYRDIYLNPDFNVIPGDDLEDIHDKINARNEYMKSIQEKKAESNGQDVKAGTEEPEKKAADAAEMAKAES